MEPLVPNISSCDDWVNTPGSEKNPRSSSKFRFLIILLGPTGAGKSDMSKNLKKNAQTINSAAYRNDWFEKVIDDYVEESEIYKTKMSALIEANRESITTARLDGCSIYDPPWKGIAKEMVKIYFEARNEGKIVDRYNEEFKANITAGKNIVFEITGRNKLTVIEALNRIMEQTNNCKDHKYIVLAGYSIVEYFSLQARNISRFQKTLQEFLADPTKKPPRLPWVGCFSHRVEGEESGIMSYCEMLHSIKNTVTDLIQCGYFYSQANYERQNRVEKMNKSKAVEKERYNTRITTEGRCFLDKTSLAAGEKRPELFIPKGLYIDYFYIYNNIYTTPKLMAKINLSKRSFFLENPEHFNLKGRPLGYFESAQIPTLLDIITKLGPPMTSDGVFYDVCGVGTPIATSTRQAKASLYIQKNLGKYSGGDYLRNTTRKKSGKDYLRNTTWKKRYLN
jgi:broad-specificity NMP kinase